MQIIYIRTFAEVAIILIAQNKNQQLILADPTLNKNQTYYCPSCHKPVHLKLGSIIRPHFAHFQNDTCDVFAEGETFEHVEGKMQLYQWLKTLGLQVAIEAYLPALKQRPDLLVYTSPKPIALEFQCSPIPIEKVVERTRGYLEAGYEVVWILGKKFTYKNRLTAFHKACLSKELKLVHYDTERKQIIIRSQFYLNQQERMHCQKRVIKFGEAFTLPKSIKQKKIQKTPNIQQRHKQLLRLRSDKKQHFQQLLYQKNESLISMPKELYTVLPSEWMIQDFSYLWKYRLLLWLENQPQHKIITKKSLANWLKQGKIEYYEMPQLTTEQSLQPLYEFLDVLTQSQCVKKISNQKWSFHHPAKRYKFLEDKLKFDEFSHTIF